MRPRCSLSHSCSLRCLHNHGGRKFHPAPSRVLQTVRSIFPRLPDGKPDFSGVWNPPMGYIRDLAKDMKEPVPFQPSVKALYDVRAAGVHWREEPDANCLPQGVPKVLLAPAPWRVVQTLDRIFFVHEAFNLWWQVFMDGREFVPSADITPTWHGYSTGKWDGDTLVIDSRGFHGKVWLDQLGKPSTEALH